MNKNIRRKLVCEINRLLIYDNRNGKYSVYSPHKEDCLLQSTCLDFAKIFSKNFTKYVALPVSERSKRYLSQYIQIEDNITLAIGKHAMRYMLHGDICAYYKDMEDFFSDWCSIGYTRTEARKLLHSGHGEFMKLPDNLGYIRFAI